MPPAFQNPFVVWLVLSAALAVAAWYGIRKELRWRAILYGSFLIACGVAIWPPYDREGQPGRIRLGLDLKGGIHLVLQVMTDDALNVTVDDAVATTREQAAAKGITFASAQRASTTAFAVEGVEPARVKDMRTLLNDFFREWEVREPAEGRFLVEMPEVMVKDLRQKTVDQAIRTLEQRVNQLGVSEPVIARTGSHGDQILVQLPGVKDVEQAKRIIRTTAQLMLKLVEGEPATSREALLERTGGRQPENLEIVQGPGSEPGQPVYYMVRREALITGRDLKNTRVGVDENNQPAVHFTLTPQGADRFKRETGRNVGKRLAIILDGMVTNAPNIREQISGEGQISGGFTTQEADELSKVLRAGALPATLRYLQELTVGASLGRDSVRSGVMAASAAMAFITLFMLVYYRFSGVNAVVALTANLLILLGAMAYFGATLTLPGIAGIILTVGVGVDTNVLVFERIREELRAGKTVKAAVSNGFERVWITILDTHATALIAAAFLFQFGTGPIKGFAVTLVMGLVANIFASYFVSKFLFEWVLGGRSALQPAEFSI
jgi:preprotein translocase subunit SecD